MNGIQEVASSILAGSTKFQYMEHTVKTFRGIVAIGIIEILIGGITLLGTGFSVLLSANPKPPNVLFFVVIAACCSTAIGLGMLRVKKWAYQLLLYFASVIFLSKILIFMDIIHLNGALVCAVPRWLNQLISMGYHGWLFVYLQNKKIKEVFHI